MHTDLTWQRTIDRRDSLRREARCWRLCVRPGDIDPAQLVRPEQAGRWRALTRYVALGAAER